MFMLPVIDVHLNCFVRDLSHVTCNDGRPTMSCQQWNSCRNLMLYTFQHT